MSRLRESLSTPRSQQYIVIFLAALTARLVYWRFAGTQVIGDANAALRRCEQIFTTPELVFLTRDVLYSGFNIPYCTALNVFGLAPTHWVGVQAVLSALACVLVFDTGRRVVNPLAGWVAGLGFVPLWETFRWIVRPQSEMLFTFYVALVLWQMARYFEQKTTRNRRVLGVCFAVLAVSRPFGFPMVLGWLAYELLPLSHPRRFDFIRSRTIAAVLAVVGVVGMLAVVTLFHEDYNIIYFLSRGTVVTGGVFEYQYTPRPADEFWPFIFLNIDNLAIMASLRIVWFFIPIVPRWSTAHILLNLVTLAPLIAGGLVGIYYAIQQRRLDILQMWLTPLAAVLLVIAATYLDGGFNYRAQMTPVFALFTGYAVGSSQLCLNIYERIVSKVRTGKYLQSSRSGG